MPTIFIRTSAGLALLISCSIMFLTFIGQAWQKFDLVSNVVIVQISRRSQLAQVGGGGTYYVDATYTGSTKDGSAGRPWTNIGTTQWQTLNNNLASSDVTVYFSARTAGSDTGDSYNNNFNIYRTDTSSHRLTLDGMSYYNTDDANPSWVSYSGSAKMKIMGKYSIAIGSSDRMDNLTLRGFEVSGPQARVKIGGNNVVAENLYIHDTSEIDPALGVNYYVTKVNGICTVRAGHFSNIIIRNNIISNSMGEGIYIGGAEGCTDVGNSHDNILIENNTITNTGANGGQGDAIDIKDGMTNITLRGNTIRNPRGAGAVGIAATGVHSGKQNLVIERNFISGAEASGISIGSGWGVPNGVAIRNNIVVDNGSAGISISGAAQNSLIDTDVAVYNNTLYGNKASGISVGNFSGVTIRNNLMFGNGILNANYQFNKWGTGQGLTSDYNLYHPRFGMVAEGSNSVLAPSADNLVSGISGGNFTLNSGSPAIATGLNLFSSFSNDYSGASRPSSGPWSIGAYEYGSTPSIPGSSPTPVPNATPTPASNLSTIRVTTTGSSGKVVGSSINCQTGSTIACSGVFANGTLVTLAANPDPGSSFTAWGGACSGSSTWCTLTINGDVSVTATFGSTPPTPTPIPNATPTPDTTPPVLSAIQANPTSSGANISFTSNEPSSTQIEYGLTTVYGNTTALNSTLTTSHTQTIYNLTPNTIYHYRIISKDSLGNTSISPDLTFTTPDSSTATPVPTPMSYATPTPRAYAPTPTTAVRVTSNPASRVLPGTTLNHPLSSSTPIPQLDSDIDIAIPRIPSWLEVLKTLSREIYLDIIYGMEVTGEWLTGR